MKNILIFTLSIFLFLVSCKKNEIEENTRTEEYIINCSITERVFSNEDITLILEDIEPTTITTNIILDEFNFIDENVGYGIGTNLDKPYGVWKTIDGGRVWSLVYENQNRVIVDFHPINNREVLILLSELSDRGEVVFILVHMLFNDILNEYSIPNLKKGLYMSFINKDIGIIGTDSSQGELFTTIDGGRNWKNQPISVSINDELMSYQQKIFLQTNQGIYVSTDCGTSWNERNRIIIRAKEIKNYKNDFYLMTNSEGLYKTDSTFTSLTQQSDKVLAYWEVIDKNTIVGIDDNKIFLSNDEGRNWINKSIGTGSSGERIRYCQWINPKIAYILDNYSGINRLTKIKINK